MNRALTSLSLLTLSLIAPTVLATPLTVQGSNTLRLEYYDNSGNPAGSPFAFEGGQAYDEFTLNLRQRLSPYRNWQAQSSGVFNASEYRAQRRNELLIERWNIKGECGDCFIPVRAEVGDYQAFFSLGTLQRSLKGVQFEVQPNLHDNRDHSIQLIAGANTRSWREADFNDDQTVGASWLIADKQLGRFSLNFSQNQRNIDGSLKQRTIGLAGKTEWQMLNRKFSLETESNYFTGDLNNNASGLDRDDYGVFLQLSSKQKRAKGNYRVRFERYGEDYRPNGAIVSNNRRSIEAHGSWRFDSGLRGRGRLQHFRDALESDNPFDTRTLGASLSGNLLGKNFKRVNGSLSGFLQLSDNANNSVDRQTASLNTNINFPLISAWTGTSGFSYNKIDDSIGAGDRESLNLRLGAIHRIAWSGLNGQISPSINLRKITTTSTSRDTSFGLAASVSKGNHNVSMNTRYNQNRPGVAADTDIANLSVNYRYRQKRSTYGIEFSQDNRDPVNEESSSGMRLALFWSYNFDKTFRTKSLSASEHLIASPSSNLDILIFSHGQQLSKINVLPQLSFSQLGNFMVSETVLLNESDQRQRLVIRQVGDEVDFSVLIIDFDDVGNLDSAAQIFEQTRRLLVNRYGAADTFFERGEFDANLAAQVNSDTFIRIMQWNTDKGILRFGIPRRLDGQVRMELHYAERFRATTDTLWSVEEIQ